MLTVRVIPCLDVKNGRTVKGVRFENLRDAGDPAELAARYDAEGADEICFLDISATQEGRSALLDTVRRTADVCFTPLTVGGGVRTEEDMRAYLLAGADKVGVNSAAVADIDVVSRCARRFGRQCVVVAIDAKRVGDGWRVHTHGGTRATDIDAVAFARAVADKGAGEILLTSMDRDGAQTGYDLALLKAVTAAVDIPVIASGGVGHVDHFAPAVLEGGANAVLAASIFHFATHTIAEAKAALAAAGAPVRPV